MVYGYIAYEEDIPRYVGIGKKNRWWHVNSGESHNPRLNGRVSNGTKFQIKLYTFETRELAEKWEIETIRNLGRKDLNTGPLFNNTIGGDGGPTNLNRIWIQNLETGELRMILKDSTIPIGFSTGRPDTLLNVRKYRKIINLETNRVSAIPLNAQLPNGWRYGSCATNKGRIWATNLSTKETKMVTTLQEGWVRGRLEEQGYHWINNGQEQQKVLSLKDIPEGWVAGTLSNKIHKRIWAYNPETNKRARFVSEKDLPEGWKLGQHVDRAGKSYWITNGLRSRKLKVGEVVPKDWKYGRLPHNEETKKKMSKSAKLKPKMSLAARIKISEALKKRIRKPVTEETKAKIRAAAIEQHKNKTAKFMRKS